MSEFMSQFEW